MVEKLNNLIAQVEQEKGKVLLFMLLKNLPNDDTWSIIISADWIEQEGQNVALQYWISKIRSTLLKNELSQINRVSFLKPHDRIVNLITSAVRVESDPVNFSKNQIGDLYIDEAVIFRSRKSVRRMATAVSDRNPVYNHNINPIYNHNINPVYNHNINPIYNHNINPVYNHNINPIYNHNINPVYNHNINPIYNHNINPVYNPGFSGFYLYNGVSKQIGYLIYANEEIILLFNLDSNLQAAGAKNSINGYTLFDDKGNWLGTMIPDTQNGFIFYSKDNSQIGFIK